MRETPRTLSVEQRLDVLWMAIRQAVYDGLADTEIDIRETLADILGSVRAESGHHTLAQGERLIAWRERAEAAEAENQRLREANDELQQQINQWEAEDYDRQQQ